MIIGDKNTFAIELTVKERVNGWDFGVFLIWVCGHLIGDAEDSSVDTKGCVNWLRDFLTRQVCRFELGLFSMEKSEVWKRLVNPVLVNKDNEKEFYENTFERFHISHIGMSSFDRFTVILVCDEDRNHRVLWQCGDGLIMDGRIQAGYIESTVEQVVEGFALDSPRSTSRTYSMKPAILILKNLLNDWEEWSNTADKSEDGWQGYFPNWEELIAIASEVSTYPDLSDDQFQMIEKCWEISEEGEDLNDYAKTHLTECWTTLVKLANSRFPEVRWQIYEALSEAEGKGESLLRAGLEDSDAYCKRRAILSLAKFPPTDFKEISERFFEDSDPYIRQAARALRVN